MKPAQFLAHFDRISEAPDAIPRLRQFILDLAVRGKLLEQDPNDELASELLRGIQTNKAKLIEKGDLRRERPDRSASPSELGFPLPRGWVAARFSQIVLSLQTGPFGSVLHRSDYSKSGTPVVNPACIKKERIVPIDGMAVGAATLQRLAVYKLRTGDIVLGRRGEMGRCAVITESEKGWLCGTGSIILRLPKEIYPRFLVTLLGSPMIRKHLGGSAVGMIMQSLNHSILMTMVIGLPPLAEQSRIVAKVDELMALCDRLEAAQAERENRRERLVAAALHRLNEPADPPDFRENARFHLRHLPRLATRPEHVQQLRQTILSLAVRGKLVSQDPKDEPAALFLRHRRLDLDSRCEPFELPVGWAWSSFSLIGETIGGGTPSKGNPEFWVGSIPWVSPKDMKADFIGDAQDHIAELALKHSPAKLIPPGALLMVVRGMILAHSFPAAVSTAPLTINQDMKAVVPFRTELVRLLRLIAKGMKPEILRLVLRSTHGTCKLLTEDLFQLPLPIPPLTEQSRIVAKVDELMGVCDRLKAQLTAARSVSRRLLEAVLYEALAPTA